MRIVYLKVKYRFSSKKLNADLNILNMKNTPSYPQSEKNQRKIQQADT